MNIKLNLSVLSTLILMCAFVLGVQAQETFKTCYVKGDSCYTATYTTTGGAAKDYTSRHVLFKNTTNMRARRLARLGSNPQFGTLKNYTTTQEVYDHLKRAYTANDRGNARELDKIWTSMGYAGFNDPSFTVSSITPVFYNPGVKGMLGAGGNSYLYAEIYNNGTGNPLKGYRITAPDGNDVTIMEICGNAFYQYKASTPNQLVSVKACPLNLGDVSNKSVTSYLQDGKCYVRVCDKPAAKEQSAPTVVTSLNHNQQFGPMTDLKTADEVVARLKELHKENKNGNRAEIDRLLRTIGYTKGINDGRFTVDQVEVIRYEGGVAAIMGGGEHQYMFSEISTPQYDVLRGFKIKSLNDECDLTIIDVCGNALYCPQPMNCKTIECGCN